MKDRRGRRRGRALLACAVGTSLLAAGCAEGFTGTEVRSNEPRSAPAPAEVRAASVAVADLGAQTLRSLAAIEVGNVAVSPSALAVQLAMVAAGADTSSADALDRLIGDVGLTTETAGRTTLDGSVAVPSGRGGTRRSPQRSGPVSVDTAIALWIQRGPVVAETFLDELGRSHGTGLRQLDFRSDPEGARAAVNLWTGNAVADSAVDPVTPVAPTGSITARTRLLSTAAQTVRAPWLLPFDPLATGPAPFTTATGETVKVPMMALNAPTGLRWGNGTDWQAVGLPYLGRELFVVVAVADPGAPDLTARLDGQLVTRIIESLAPRALSVRLPRTSINLATSLTRVLSEAGAGIVFDTDLADLTAAAPTERLALTDVLQAVRLELDEEGSDARAATLSDPSRRPPTQPTDVTVDRPFLLMVVDLPTRIPLLMANVVNPA